MKSQGQSAIDGTRNVECGTTGGLVERGWCERELNRIRGVQRSETSSTSQMEVREVLVHTRKGRKEF